MLNIEYSTENINSTITSGEWTNWTPLQVAIWLEDVEKAQKLLQLGADPNRPFPEDAGGKISPHKSHHSGFRSWGGWTPLAREIWRITVRKSLRDLVNLNSVTISIIIKLLIQYGSNCNEIIDQGKFKGWSLLMLAVAQHDHNPKVMPAIIESLLTGKFNPANPNDIFPASSENYGKEVNKFPNPEWPLLAFSVENKMEIVAHLLIARGVDQQICFTVKGIKTSLKNYIEQKKMSRLFSRETEVSTLTICRSLGTGTFGEVNLGIWEGLNVATKTLRNNNDKEIEEDFEQEATIHSSLIHPNIVALYAIAFQPRRCLIMEFMVNASLYDVLHNGADLPWSWRLSIAIDICQALLYLHSQIDPIIHGDLKSLNVLLDHNMRAKLADFGSAKIIKNSVKSSTSQTTKPVGTYPWMAPELLKDPQHGGDQHSDIYALGITFWEMATRKTPHEKYKQMTMIRLVSEGHRDPIPPETPSQFSELIESCWAQDSQQRPTAEQVVATITKMKL